MFDGACLDTPMDLQLVLLPFLQQQSRELCDAASAGSAWLLGPYLSEVLYHFIPFGVAKIRS